VRKKNTLIGRAMHQLERQNGSDSSRLSKIYGGRPDIIMSINGLLKNKNESHGKYKGVKSHNGCRSD